MGNARLRAEWAKRWPHFSPEEVLSPVGLQQWETFGRVYINPHAMDFLHAWREKVGRIIVNNDHLRLRGYRSPAENASISGSAALSRHVQGLAFDTTPLDMDLYKYFQLAKEFGWTGIGFYPKKHFVHLDIRPSFKQNPDTWIE